jgi:hypothetical protein
MLLLWAALLVLLWSLPLSLSLGVAAASVVAETDDLMPHPAVAPAPAARAAAPGGCCQAALAAGCGAARKSDPASCLACIGRHQRDLRVRGCPSAAVADCCAVAPPDFSFSANIQNTTGASIIPNTTWDSISAFTWIGTWETLDPVAVAELNISSRYPFLRYAELFCATGGCAEGFVDHQSNKTCQPWMDADAPLDPSGARNWSRLLRAVDNVRAAGLHPYIVTGNVPVK